MMVSDGTLTVPPINFTPSIARSEALLLTMRCQVTPVAAGDDDTVQVMVMLLLVTTVYCCWGILTNGVPVVKEEDAINAMKCINKWWPSCIHNWSHYSIPLKSKKNHFIEFLKILQIHSNGM